MWAEQTGGTQTSRCVQKQQHRKRETISQQSHTSRFSHSDTELARWLVQLSRLFIIIISSSGIGSKRLEDAELRRISRPPRPSQDLCGDTLDSSTWPKYDDDLPLEMGCNWAIRMQPTRTPLSRPQLGD